MKNSQLIDKSLKVHHAEQKRYIAMKWIIFNTSVLAVLFFDIYKTSKHDYDEIFYWIELSGCFIIFLSLLKNIVTYLYYVWSTDEIVCDNEEQKILLNLTSSNSSLKKRPQAKESTDMPAINESITNIRNLSWQNYGDQSSANLNSQMSWASNASMNSLDSTFTVYSDISANFQSPSRFNNSDQFIMNKKKMSEFLADVSTQENNVANAIEAQQNLNASNYNSTFWSGFDVNGFISSLKNLTYQLSPHNKQSSRDESFNKDEETSEIIRQMSANKLSNYVANLKLWIHKTILEPLVHAIDETDKAFEQRGFTDMKIGHVGIERLKKIASSNQHLVQHIPTLPKIIPFLELSTNQEFLVQRYRELAKGSCLKNYKFTSGSIDGHSSQNDHIPNDAAVIFHLFCTYLDLQLQPFPDIQRPFYNRYVIIGDAQKGNVENLVKESARNKAKCSILCSNPITPKFNFVTDKIHGSSGRNNLFHVLIQFLFHLKADGMMLENVSLGKSGLNLLNIIED